MAQKRKSLLYAEECKPLTQTQVEDIKAQFNPLNTANVNIIPYHIYDGTERVVGTWFGKPLYCKGLNRVSSSDPVSGSITTIETNTTYRLVDIKGFITLTAGSAAGGRVPLPYVADGVVLLLFQDADYKIKLYWWTQSGNHPAWGGTYNIVLYYTKTTD